MAQDINEKIAFAVAPEGQGDGVPVLILGVPEGAWKYMQDGKTHTFDLSRIGLPIKLVLFGCESHDAAMATLNQIMAARGQAYDDRRGDDFSIQPKETKP